MAENDESKGDGLSNIELDSEALMKGLVDDSRRFFRDLLDSNQGIRRRCASLEERLARSAEELAEARRSADRAAELERENQSLARELAGLKQRFEEVEFEQQDFSARYQQIEEQYATVANLYVATYQLHATLVYGEVLSVAKEIMANLVGVKRMRLYLRTNKNNLLLAAEIHVPTLGGPGEGKIDAEAIADPLLAKVLIAGASYYRPASAEAGILAAIPLRIRKTVVGILVIDELLAQKERLTGADEQMFELLGGHLAVALARSRKGGGEAQSTLADQEIELSNLLLVS